MGKSDRNGSRNWKKYWLALFVIAVPLVAAPLIFSTLNTLNIPTTSTTSTTETPPNEITVYLSPACMCCMVYTDYLKGRGFEVRVVQVENVTQIKSQYGIPRPLWSCHTSVIGGYFVEGHVPVEAIQKLLDEKPDVDGISLPGMPSGSPGMPGGKKEPFVIYAVKNGESRTFMTM